MPVTDEQLQLIFRYFDDELSEEEEISFINQLETNPELQQAFDQQVLVSEHLSKQEPEINFATNIETADKFIENIKNTIIAENPKHEAVIPINNRKYWLWAAAAAAIIVLFSIYNIAKNNQQNNTLVKTPIKNNPSLKPDNPLPDSSHLLADNANLEKIYTDYYAVLPENELTVPSSATPYQWQYNHQQYKELTTINETDLAVKGDRSLNEKNEILNYFYFYKALSNIEINKPLIAEKLLKDLLAKNLNNPNLNNKTNWYLLMVYLKNTDKQNALLMAESIAKDSKSPYNKKAIEIEKKLR